MKTNRILLSALTLGLVAILGCKKEDVPAITSTNPNILLIIADDLGKDALSGYTEGNIKPNTPHLDSIRNSGITFSNFWVYPTCSPTRASIITGKYGYRTGVKWAGDELSANETILQNYINQQTGNAYATAIVGKWHLSDQTAGVNPETFGLDYYIGLIRGAVQDYFQWQITEDGSGSQSTEYTTTHFTNLAIDWINAQSKPWFMWLAYNAPHTPFHAPPAEMHSQGNLPEFATGADPIPYYMAAIEALDYQVGELLDALSEQEKQNTLILFIGDNGTPNQVAQSPYSSQKVKGTLYQGGINTPMFVAGSGVTRTGTDNNLVTSTDLFATIAATAGVSVTEIHDSKSFTSLFTQNETIRDYQYAEMNDGTEEIWTISNGNYKLIIEGSGNEEFYNLENDPYENTNLLSSSLSTEEANAKADLEAELSRIRD